MSEEKLWKTWKARWKKTEEDAIDIVKEIFRLEGTRPIEKQHIPVCSDFEYALDFAVEMGWLKDHRHETYRVTCSGLLMLAHQLKT